MTPGTHPLDMDFIAECQVEDGSYIKSRQYLGQCIANVGGYLIMKDKYDFIYSSFLTLQ